VESDFVGIARLARQSPLLEAKHSVEYFELPTRRYIGRCSGSRMPFEWTVNPYRGCEYGCKYCYARFAHEFMELRDSREFENKIFAKSWDAAEFRRELLRVPHGESIALGTATDPYQPAERRFGITRKMLHEFARDYGHQVWVTTKSDLVARDVDLLKQIAARNHVQVSVTITTAEERLARMLEPRAPTPALRLAAVKKLADNGIRVGVLASPIMPLLNDSEGALDRLGALVSETGANFFSGSIVFLKPSAQAAFFPFLEEHFPHLLRRYRERFSGNGFLKGSYPDTIQERLRAVRQKHGLKLRTEAPGPLPGWSGQQLHLFDSQ
jgi:DNA repair photolyase